jgi:hypothetical protein
MCPENCSEVSGARATNSLDGVTDPRGISVSLEDVWQEHTAYRPEILTYFDAIRVTVQNPDAIYFDPKTTARRTTGARIYLYYRSNLTQGKYAGNYICVVVKVVLEPDNVQRGYVESASLPGRTMKRAVLEWKR